MRVRLTVVLICALAAVPVWATAAAPSSGQATGHDHSATAAASTAPDLDRLLAEIDKATGEAKMSLMATVLKRLVAERHSPKPAHEVVGAGASQHGSMCPMCAAHKASQAAEAAESHAEHTGAAADAASPGCAMMSQKK